MRIVSLLPAATEIVAALGLADRLVGRSHECDRPAGARRLPVVTRGLLTADPADPAAIDREVAARAAAGEALYALDEDALARARPDLIVTQSLCGVCAVAEDAVAAVAAALPSRPVVLSLAPSTLDGVIDSALAVGAAAGAPEAAARLAAGLRARLDALRRRVAGRSRPRIVCLEWLEPPFLAGHWVPDQVAAAGGLDLLGRPGLPSARATPAEVAAAAPEALVLMPCGWGLDEAAAGASSAAFLRDFGDTPAVRAGRVAAVAAGDLFSRPGPRLVDGAELLAALLHPGAAGPVDPTAGRWLAPAPPVAGARAD